MAISNKNLNYLDNLKSLLQMGAVRQLLFMVAIAISVTLGIVLYLSIQEPLYRPLDYQVNDQNASAIIDTLNKAGIQYKMNEHDGIILIPAKDMQLAKMKLSSAGIAKDDGFNYAFLNDKTNIANSQFLENLKYVRALENDLAKTINAIEGVKAAKVHIAIPQNSVFADENNKTTASVVINITPGWGSDKEKIRSIIQIVAGSVPALDPKDVAITDQYGHFLSDNLEQANLFSAAQLEYQNNVQRYYEKRIESMITPIIGENKVTVRVNADIDFTQQENAQEQYDPDKKVIRSEQTMTEQADSSASSGVPGALSNSAPSDDNDKAKPTTPSSAPGGRSQNTRNYELSKTVTYKKSNFAKIKNLSVAVIVDNDQVVDPKTQKTTSKPIDQTKLTNITELIKTTIGYDQARGDKVTVINSGYNITKQNIPVIETHFWEQPWLWDVVRKSSGIAFGLLFLMLLYRKISHFAPRHSIETKQVMPTDALKSDTQANLSVQQAAQQHEFKQDGVNKLKELAAGDPNRVASIIKNWVGKS